MHKKTLAASLILLLGLAPFAAGADELQVHTQGNVSYVMGGVGEEHAQAMQAVRRGFPLSLLFVRKDKPKNAYLADVPVTIKDARGKAVLETTSDGPFLYVKLPPGQYVVSATHEGKTRTAHVYVSRKGRKHLVFEWAE